MKSPTGRLGPFQGPNLQQVALNTPEYKAIRDALVGNAVERDMTAYLERRPPLGQDYRSGQWVVVAAWGDIVGMVGNVTLTRVEVRTANSVPGKYYARNSLRWATMQEVVKAGYDGIGYVGSPFCPG